jgi:hypothetical protein
MDGNPRARGVAKRFGVNLDMIQQTFVVPSDTGAAAGWDRARDDLVEWLQYAQDFLLERELTLTIHDVLFVPQDSPFPFLLSASADGPGFAVSYAFETSEKAELERIKRAFSEMAEVLGERFGGRVYLVKNVCAEQGTPLWPRCTATTRSPSSASNGTSTPKACCGTTFSSGPSAICSRQTRCRRAVSPRQGAVGGGAVGHR